MLLLFSVTLDPPVGAACDNVTVQLDVLAELTVVGVHCNAVAVTVTVGDTVSEAVAEPPFSVAVTVAVWLEVTVAAVAVNVAVVAPAATVTEAGTVSAVVLLLFSVTLDPPVGAACDNVTVQLDVPAELTVVGVHCTAVTVTVGDTVSEAVAEPPFSVAVTVAVWLEVTVAAVAVNVAVVAPAATVTEAGTVTTVVLLLVSVTLDPPVGAACDNVTVQLDVPAEARVVGVHCSAVTIDSRLMVPPVPETATNVPPGSVPIVLLITSESKVPAPLAGIVAVTTATTPVPMAVSFIPVARHVREPAPDTQESVSPADVSAEPATALSELILPAG